MKSVGDFIKGASNGPRNAQESDGAECSMDRLRELANRSNSEQVRIRREESLQWCGLGKRFIELGFDDYQATSPEQAKALDVCKRFGTNFRAVLEHGSNLIMLGTTGSGKTHLAGAILTTIIRAGYTGKYFTVPQLIREIRDCWSKASEVTERQMLKRLAEYDLLIIDEVGVQYGSDAERVTLFEIVNARYEQVRPTAVISNLTIRTQDGQGATIDDALGDRLVDRLKHNGVVVPFTWPSYRARQNNR